jgi:hypothetical protein
MGRGIALLNGRLLTTSQGGLATLSGAALVRARIARMVTARQGELESHPDWGNPSFAEVSAPTEQSRAERWAADLKARIEEDPGVKAVTVFELTQLGQRTWRLRLLFDTDEFGEQEQDVTF